MEKFIIKGVLETAKPMYHFYFIASEPPDKLVLQELVPDVGKRFQGYDGQRT